MGPDFLSSRQPESHPSSLRIGAELFGQYFSLHIADCDRRKTLQITADARTKLDAIVSQLSIGDEIRDSLGNNSAGFPNSLRATELHCG